MCIRDSTSGSTTPATSTSGSTTPATSTSGSGSTHVVHTAATAEEILAALKTQGISTLEDLVATLVKTAHEQGGEDNVPDTVDLFIHPNYVLYHDDTHLAEGSTQ